MRLTLNNCNLLVPTLSFEQKLWNLIFCLVAAIILRIFWEKWQFGVPTTIREEHHWTWGSLHVLSPLWWLNLLILSQSFCWIPDFRLRENREKSWKYAKNGFSLCFWSSCTSKEEQQWNSKCLQRLSTADWCYPSIFISLSSRYTLIKSPKDTKKSVKTLQTSQLHGFAMTQIYDKGWSKGLPIKNACNLQLQAIQIVFDWRTPLI